MGKRKGRSVISEDPIREGRNDYDEIRREEEKEKGGFFACYLLTSLSPRHKGHTYIGFTVNPHRRIRQHNGEMSCGAWRTKRKRPWEMVLCIYGFPTNVSALQFEWAWQHPTESLAVRKAAATFKSLSGIANKIKLAYTMLTLPAWQSLNLTVNFFSTKYTKHYAGCPSLPEHMKVQVCSMDELPCYTGSDHNMYENEDQWDYDRECDEPVSVYQSAEEGLRNKILNNFTDHQKCIEETTHGKNEWVEDIDERRSWDLTISKEDYKQPVCLSNSPVPVLSSSVASTSGALETVEDKDHQKCIEETTHGKNEWVEDIDERQSWDLPISKEDYRQPVCLSNSPVPVLSSSVASTSGALETVEDKDMFGLIEESRVELDWLTRKHSLTITAANKDQPPTKPCEVEIIDVLSPSPSYRGKKRRVSIVCPEIIDLTNSPIFV